MAMLSDLQQEYAKLNDDELLHLASERSSLTDEAILALDTEMRTRELTDVEVASQASFVRRSKQRERRRRDRKLFGTRRGQREWIRFVVTALLVLSAALLVALSVASFR